MHTETDVVHNLDFCQAFVYTFSMQLKCVYDLGKASLVVKLWTLKQQQNYMVNKPVLFKEFIRA